MGEALDRARSIAAAGGIEAAVRRGALPQFVPVTLSEALVLGLLAQGVRKFLAVFGHGSTDLGSVLAAYEAAGLLRTYNVRSEIEASHAAAMLRWHYGETAAVVTSIGPGAHQAMAASLVPLSNGLGVYYLSGDETTHAEGPNLQAIPGPRQHSMLSMVDAMASGYCLHTPQAVFTALRRGAATVFHPTRASPFFFLLPMNTQPAVIRECNLLELCGRPTLPAMTVADDISLQEATDLARGCRKITIKYGGGARGCGAEMVELARLLDAVIVSGAGVTGVLPYSEPRFMAVGGSKGSICGNYAMEEADLVIAIGARGVCQWDCSGTAWKNAKAIINFNADPVDAMHYNRSVPILGDARRGLRRWIDVLRASGMSRRDGSSEWLGANQSKKAEWDAFKRRRFEHPTLFDPVWKREVLTQPAAIRLAWEFARDRKAACYFDAGDVQANGFQLIEDEQPGMTFTDTGSSYMGFAVSALLAGALADRPVYAFAFSGDGSFTMSPQILVDGVEHGVRGCILLFDNRRMAAISGLQVAQYEKDYHTSDSVQVDYVALASSVKGVKGIFGGYDPRSLSTALETAIEHPGLSLIHIPVYWGSDELGWLGVYGSWNVGNWCEAVQAEHHRIGL